MVGLSVGAMLGDAVGDELGVTVGDSVGVDGTLVGDAVWAASHSNVHSYMSYAGYGNGIPSDTS